MGDASDQRATGSAGLDASIDALWGAVRPFAVSLRDVIMLHSHSPISSFDGSSAAPPIIPSVQSRRAACTHLNMERLYGDYECMVCHRPSAWEWLYSCSQDDSDDELTAGKDHTILPPVTLLDLPPWTREAIAKGHYTEGQVETMIEQRRKVLDTILASEAHFKKTQATVRCSSSRRPRPISTTIEANGHLPFPVITEFASSSADSTRLSLDQSFGTRPRIFPLCRYRACQMCRPTYRDRTWQVLEDAFAARTLPADIYEDDPGRPVSDLKFVSSIGARKKAKPRRPPLRNLDSTGIYTINSEGQLTLQKGNIRQSASLQKPSPDLADQRAEADSKGFRDSMKRAFKGMLISRKRESWGSKYSRKSARKAGAPDNDSAEFDLGLWKELSEDLLREAAGVPLPGHDGKDGLDKEGDEVEVQDGVAVTEEAVGLGAADIIMSV
ncbi:MAG: hypothetical protein Q9207_007482 [Kuettlingeria erythrocarpa]